jgi:hypothetical protein
VHLRDGRWVEGRKIRHPPLNVDWYENPSDGRKMFQPAKPPGYYPGVAFGSVALPAVTVPMVTNTIVGFAPTGIPTLSIAAPVAPIPPNVPVISPAPQNEDLSTLEDAAPSTIGPAGMVKFAGVPGPTSSTWRLQVQQDGERVHVLFVTDGGFCAYRDGLEFGEDQEGVSALAAENVMQDANGWEPIPIIPSGEYIQHMVCDHDGALFSSMTGRVATESPTRS